MGSLSDRVRNILRRKCDCEPEPSRVAQFSVIDLLRLPNFGRKSLNEVRGWLAEHGLCLKGDEQRYRPPMGSLSRMRKAELIAKVKRLEGDLKISRLRIDDLRAAYIKEIDRSEWIENVAAEAQTRAARYAKAEVGYRELWLHLKYPDRAPCMLSEALDVIHGPLN